MSETQKDKLVKKILYDEYKWSNRKQYLEYIESLLEDAKNIALAELYPFVENYDELELPTKYNNWQIRACVELHQTGSMAGVKSYSEQGLSWSRENDGCLSQSLLNELTPQVGIPKRSGSNDN